MSARSEARFPVSAFVCNFCQSASSFVHPGIRENLTCTEERVPAIFTNLFCLCWWFSSCVYFVLKGIKGWPDTLSTATLSPDTLSRPLYHADTLPRRHFITRTFYHADTLPRGHLRTRPFYHRTLYHKIFPTYLFQKLFLNLNKWFKKVTLYGIIIWSLWYSCSNYSRCSMCSLHSKYCSRCSRCLCNLYEAWNILDHLDNKGCQGNVNKSLYKIIDA